MKKVLIVGTSGLAYEVVSWAENMFDIVGYTTPTKPNGNEHDLPGVGFTDEEVTPDKAKTEYVLFAIGSSKIRKKLHLLYESKGFKFPNLIHPSSTVSKSAKLGEGVIIAPHCVVSHNVVIGDMSYVNFQCGIGHDASIGSYVQINPGVQIGGFSSVGDESLIGSGSTILQGVKLGSKVVVASGSVIFAKVPDNSTFMGNPARRMRAFEK